MKLNIQYVYSKYSIGAELENLLAIKRNLQELEESLPRQRWMGKAS
jgi:hypothetical protein